MLGIWILHCPFTYMFEVLLLSVLDFILKMVIFEYNILTLVRIYYRDKKKKPDFDMSAFAAA